MKSVVVSKAGEAGKWKGAAFTLVLGTLLATACAARSNGPPVQTTSAMCTSNGFACVSDSDCCSTWCVNGECTRRQP